MCARESKFIHAIALLFWSLHYTITAGLFACTLELLQMQLSSISCTNSSGRKTCFCGPDMQLLLEVKHNVSVCDCEHMQNRNKKRLQRSLSALPSDKHNSPQSGARSRFISASRLARAVRFNDSVLWEDDKRNYQCKRLKTAIMCIHTSFLAYNKTTNNIKRKVAH